MSDKSKVEIIKENSRALRGTIAEELQEATSRFAKENTQLLKFHGIYQQEDRDLRKARREAGADKAWQFMVRIKNPGGGRLTAEQWAILDAIADRHGNGTLRITTRQGIQFHGVGKANLRGTIRDLDSQLISTFGACGDGVRNIMACPVCQIREGSSFDGQEWAVRLAKHLAFGTTSYYEIWLDGERVPSQRSEDEPLYGQAYLPASSRSHSLTCPTIASISSPTILGSSPHSMVPRWKASTYLSAEGSAARTTNRRPIPDWLIP